MPLKRSTGSLPSTTLHQAKSSSSESLDGTERSVHTLSSAERSASPERVTYRGTSNLQFESPCPTLSGMPRPEPTGRHVKRLRWKRVCTARRTTIMRNLERSQDRLWVNGLTSNRSEREFALARRIKRSRMPTFRDGSSTGKRSRNTGPYVFHLGTEWDYGSMFSGVTQGQARPAWSTISPNPRDWDCGPHAPQTSVGSTATEEKQLSCLMTTGVKVPELFCSESWTSTPSRSPSREDSSHGTP